MEGLLNEIGHIYIIKIMYNIDISDCNVSVFEALALSHIKKTPQPSTITRFFFLYLWLWRSHEKKSETTLDEIILTWNSFESSIVKKVYLCCHEECWQANTQNISFVNFLTTVIFDCYWFVGLTFCISHRNDIVHLCSLMKTDVSHVMVLKRLIKCAVTLVRMSEKRTEKRAGLYLKLIISNRYWKRNIDVLRIPYGCGT